MHYSSIIYERSWLTFKSIRNATSVAPRLTLESTTLRLNGLVSLGGQTPRLGPGFKSWQSSWRRLQFLQKNVKPSEGFDRAEALTTALKKRMGGRSVAIRASIRFRAKTSRFCTSRSCTSRFCTSRPHILCTLTPRRLASCSPMLHSLASCTEGLPARCPQRANPSPRLDSFSVYSPGRGQKDNSDAYRRRSIKNISRPLPFWNEAIDSRILRFK